MSQRTAIVIGAVLAVAFAYALVRLFVPADPSPHYDPDTISLTLRRAVIESGSTNRRAVQHVSSSGEYVHRIYMDLFGLDLPATPAEQRGLGEEIAPTRLEPGDLLFFQRNSSFDVGFYIGGIEFGVFRRPDGPQIARLDNPAWSGRFHSARRIIQ